MRHNLDCNTPQATNKAEAGLTRIAGQSLGSLEDDCGAFGVSMLIVTRVLRLRRLCSTSAHISAMAS